MKSDKICEAWEIKVYNVFMKILNYCTTRLGFEYQNSSLLKWLKRSWMPNGLVFKCHLNTGQPHHLKTGQIDAILFSYVLVLYSNGRSVHRP